MKKRGAYVEQGHFAGATASGLDRPTLTRGAPSAAAQAQVATCGAAVKPVPTPLDRAPLHLCRRDRADKLDKVKRNDPAYERLQDEKKRREEKKKGWKIFDPD